MKVTAYAARRIANGTAARLGLFSIALGIAELLLTKRLARATGLQGRENLLRLYGVREIATGVGLLSATTARKRAPWMWARVAGDALDIATLASAPGKMRAAAAMVAVGGVTALDVQTARTLSASGERLAWRDYSDRSGFPRPAAQMRGVASDVARESTRWMRRPAIPGGAQPSMTGIPG